MSLNLTGWERPDKGALFVVTGASGTGKTTLVREALRVLPNLSFSVSYTTRPPRPGEVDGRDYQFVTHEAFDDALAAGGLLEWAEVYGNRDGTPREPVLAALAAGESVLLEIDVQGARQVRGAFSEATLVFVLPPSREAIEERLRLRSTDSEAVILRRIADAHEQLRGAGDFDFLVVNDDLEAAHDQFQAVLVSTLLSRSRREGLVARFAR